MRGHCEGAQGQKRSTLRCSHPSTGGGGNGTAGAHTAHHWACWENLRHLQALTLRDCGCERRVCPIPSIRCDACVRHEEARVGRPA